MQLMVNMCMREFAAIGMNINVNKSGCMRIGERHNVNTIPINIEGSP